MGKNETEENETPNGGMSKAAHIWAFVLLALSVFQLILILYTIFCQFFLVNGDDIIYWFNIIGMLGYGPLFLFSFSVFVLTFFAILGNSAGLKYLFWGIFVLLFVPLVFIYVYFASITINAIVVAILTPSVTLAGKIFNAIFGGFGMFLTLLVMMPFMIVVKRFADMLRHGLPKGCSDGVEGTVKRILYIALIVAAHLYLIVNLIIGLNRVLGNAVHWSTMVFLFSEPLHILLGFVVYVLIVVISLRKLQGEDKHDKLMLTNILFIVCIVGQCIYLVLSFWSSFVYFVYGIIGMAGNGQARIPGLGLTIPLTVFSLLEGPVFLIINLALIAFTIGTFVYELFVRH